HRERVVACEAVGGAPAYEPIGGAGAGGAAQVQDEGTCDDDSQCGAFDLGYCAYGQAGGACASGCLTDQDCPSGTICICDATPSPVGGRCVLSNCGSDRDCAPGYFCATYWPECGDDQLFACQKATDQCVSDADCSDGALCTLPSNRYDFRRCDGALCVGRPFLVADTARVAPVTARADWFSAASSTPSLAYLTTSERAALAEHWTKMGQMEHASIAAFARFSLQLLALGAPSDLVEACTQALADETAHAKLCFGIASAYAGRAIGPGPLDVSRSLEVTSLVDIVDLVILEGCFGETGAALEALEAADAATDPVIVAAYSQIAADEQRHAELAFRFVRWALERDPQSTRARIAAALSAAHLSSPIVREVIGPCLEALLTCERAA
ncbi:MAG TPA: ferritin-like domain-containing protein, partial [Polyangiaceae bacterium]|nr:ferritin-like domain-containing protein [Polyangiaceae bacterium]